MWPRASVPRNPSHGQTSLFPCSLKISMSEILRRAQAAAAPSSPGTAWPRLRGNTAHRSKLRMGASSHFSPFGKNEDCSSRPS